MCIIQFAKLPHHIYSHDEADGSYPMGQGDPGMKKIIINTLWVMLITILLLGVPRLSAMIADLLDYQAIDPDGAFAWISVRHMVQALIFILIMKVVKNIRPLEFGYGWGNKEAGRKYVLSFTIIFGAGSLVSHLITIFANSFQRFPYPFIWTSCNFST